MKRTMLNWWWWIRRESKTALYVFFPRHHHSMICKAKVQNLRWKFIVYQQLRFGDLHRPWDRPLLIVPSSENSPLQSPFFGSEWSMVRDHRISTSVICHNHRGPYRGTTGMNANECIDVDHVPGVDECLLGSTSGTRGNWLEKVEGLRKTLSINPHKDI